MSEAMASHIGDNPQEQSSTNEKAADDTIIEDMEGASHQQDLANCEPLRTILENIQKVKQLSSEACIFKVHEGLCKTNPEAYTPLIISIGPYHHGKSKLSKMEKLKELYLQSFLDRAHEKGFRVEECWMKLKKLKDRAENYYADDIELIGDEFVKMLLLDGCFTVEFIFRSFLHVSGKGQQNKYDPVFMISGMVTNVLRDMLLLENQLPFFVLHALYDMIKHGEVLEFSEMVKKTFVCMLPRIPRTNELNTQEIKHLLQVLHILCQPRLNNGRIQQARDSTCFSCWFWKQPQQSTDDFDVELCSRLTASELHEAGVDFKKVETTSRFDIKFNRGKLEIPLFDLYDETEIFYRNLIAYEQHSCDVCPKYFTDYATFMDGLINTEKDVNLLRANDVLINGLGDDKEVTYLFNKLCTGVQYSGDDFYYKSVCKELIQHCKKPRNVLKAKLRRDYFHSPWAGISTIAAIMLLSLAIAQTVIAILDLCK